MNNIVKQIETEEREDLTYAQMLEDLAIAGFIGKIECPNWNETHYLVAGNVVSIYKGFRKGIFLNDEPITFDQEDK